MDRRRKRRRRRRRRRGRGRAAPLDYYSRGTIERAKEGRPKKGFSPPTGRCPLASLAGARRRCNHISYFVPFVHRLPPPPPRSTTHIRPLLYRPRALETAMKTATMQQPLITFKIYRDRSRSGLCTLAGSILINDPCHFFVGCRDNGRRREAASDGDTLDDRAKTNWLA